MLRYLDSSALLKLIAPEPESERLLVHLADPGDEAVTSALSVVEVTRAVAGSGIGAEAAPRTEAVLAAVDLRRVDDGIIREAARLEPVAVRSLDAIHLATAIEMSGELDELVSYDRRQLEAARQHGIEAVSP